MGDEFQSLTGNRRSELLHSLVVGQWILYLLPDGNGMNRLWLEWLYPVGSVQTLHLSDITDAPWMRSSDVLAVLITRCRTVLSWASQLPVCNGFHCSSVKLTRT